MRAIRSGNIFRMIDDANIERMIVQLKSLRISLAHGREMQAMLIERGYERGIHFIAVAMTLVDNIFSINGFELAVAQLDIKSTLTGILTGIIIANTVKGYGVSFMRNDILWHYRTPQGEEYEAARLELEAQRP